jgi:putative FmdB family regulatory protein
VPRYDYDCAACGQRFELMHGVHADPPTTCPLCGSGPVRKAISAPSVHFKGSGWAKKERQATARKASSTKAGDDGPSDGDTKVAEPAAAKTAAAGDDAAPKPAKPADKKPASTTD